MYDIINQIISAPEASNDIVLLCSGLITVLLSVTVIRCIWKIFDI